ncbi:SacI homology domain-containing protein [Dipodascopsis tothii]|uniref:SacI homology domain-containing protein n=1 Tax=Dipodascopsis tothii TaxID=44089 RepID=UPI0034CDD6D4
MSTATIVRSAFVWAEDDGLILKQLHPVAGRGKNAHKIAFTDRTVSAIEWKGEQVPEHAVVIYGVIGLVEIGDGYLVVITDRDVAAQFDSSKVVYCVRNVAIVPLAAAGARSALAQAKKARLRRAADDGDADGEEDDDDDDTDDTDTSTTTPSAESSRPHSRDQPPAETAAAVPRATVGTSEGSRTSAEDAGRYTDVESASELSSRKDSTEEPAKDSVTRNVMLKKGNFGVFSKNWLFRGLSEDLRVMESDMGALPVPPPAEAEDAPARPPGVTILLPKLLRTLRTLFASQSFYFSYDIDITRSLVTSTYRESFRSSHSSSALQASSGVPLASQVRESFFYNKHLLRRFLGTPYALPVMQGFVKQEYFDVRPDERADAPDETVTEGIPVAGAAAGAAPAAPAAESPTSCSLIVMSRRSIRRAGLRYLRRGIDDNADCANFVETEQILSFEQRKYASFIQVRGSVPVFFKQSPYKLQPTPQLTRPLMSAARNFINHFDKLRESYGLIAGVSLVEKHGRESQLGDAYAQLAELYDLELVWFDFHTICKGMKFERVEELFDTTAIGQRLKEFGWTETGEHGEPTKHQIGVLRVNCVDCLDRTNVVQSASAGHILRAQLRSWAVVPDDPKRFDLIFNGIWADNGDAISRQYASTAALKGDFTRTRRRNYVGVLKDAMLTMTRYFTAMISDFFAQAAIDYVLGNVGDEVFAEFEAQMASSDPARAFSGVYENVISTAASSVIASDAEVLVGGWVLLTPKSAGAITPKSDLREIVLLLTDEALYTCSFDQIDETVALQKRIPLSALTDLQYGAYYSSPLTPGMHASRNYGFIVKYHSRKADTPAADDTDDSETTVGTAATDAPPAPATDSPDTSVASGASAPPTPTRASTGPSGASTPTTPNFLKRTTSLKFFDKPRRKTAAADDSDVPVDDSADAIMAFKLLPVSLDVHQNEGKQIAEHIIEQCKLKTDLAVLQQDIFSLDDAKSNTNVFDVLGFQMRRLVWA